MYKYIKVSLNYNFRRIRRIEIVLQVRHEE